jgi:GTP diphosphokinase / guanosine-3',5'-bis(diphosphate) 3'-diphosphatase
MNATFLRALAFAAEKHRDQRRKGAEASPYINHPIALASVLGVEAGVDDNDVLCAALLHDTIEDTETTVEELEREFGTRISAIVVEVTDDKSLLYTQRKQAQIEHAPTLSRAAKLVKLADKICNLRDVAHRPPPDWSWQRRQAYVEWAQHVVDRLRGVHAVLEGLFDQACAAQPPPPVTNDTAAPP